VTRIITIANQKGGVGKTTTTVNIAAALAHIGKRCLVVDLDPQGNATTALGIEHREGTPGVYDVLMGEKTLAEVIVECPDIPGLWGAPATIDLAGAEIELVSQVAREYRLKKAIEALQVSETFDYIILDCPPSLGLLTLNGLVAAQEVLLPIQCEYYALEGLSQLLKSVGMVTEHLNPNLAVSAIILTMYDGRTRLASQVADEVRSHFGATVLETVIPRSVRVSEAPSYGQTVLTYDPTSSGAIAYREAALQLDSLQPQT
jgi:chromosome partitioning protein